MPAPVAETTAADLASAADILQAADGMDEARRRLVFVRYLVRQRVYNEGFSPDALPEHYRWSGQGDTSGDR